jgi:hypothetical protein
MEIQTLTSNKKYVITYEGLLFVGLYVSTDVVHHFEDVYGLSDTPDSATFSKQCTFYGPIEPAVEIETILYWFKDMI